MNQAETLALFAQGRDAWNAWADEMLAEKHRLVEAGEDFGGIVGSDFVQAWKAKARSDFSGHVFSEDVDFQKYRFPGDAVFREAAFPGDAYFNRTSFDRIAQFAGLTAEKIFSLGGAVFRQREFRRSPSARRNHYRAEGHFGTNQTTDCW